eukprot:COSAG01_NODE_15503_length_1330_cov_1.397238_3_plen_117_part_00
MGGGGKKLPVVSLVPTGGETAAHTYSNSVSTRRGVRRQGRCCCAGLPRIGGPAVECLAYYSCRSLAREIYSRIFAVGPVVHVEYKWLYWVSLDCIDCSCTYSWAVGHRRIPVCYMA